MAKYHINGKGEPGRCSAHNGNCPFGEYAPHYSSAEQAREAYEQTQRHEQAFAPMRAGTVTNDEIHDHLVDLARRHQLISYERDAAEASRVSAERDLAAYEAYNTKAKTGAEIRSNMALIEQARKSMEHAEGQRDRWEKEMADIDREALDLVAKDSAADAPHPERLYAVESDLAAAVISETATLARLAEARRGGSGVTKPMLDELDARQRTVASLTAEAQKLRETVSTNGVSEAQIVLRTRSVLEKTGDAIVSSRRREDGSVEVMVPSRVQALTVARELSSDTNIVEIVGQRAGGQVLRVHDTASMTDGVYRASDFRWDGDSFVSDASALPSAPTEQFLLTSQKDGTAVRLHLANVDQRGGEYLSWTYRPEDSTRNWSVTIFND